MASSGDGGEHTHGKATASLMAMADYMLGQCPQQVERALHCLLAAISLRPPQRVEAHLQLRVGSTLYYHSNNLLEARQHLEQAVSDHTHHIAMVQVWLSLCRCFLLNFWMVMKKYVLRPHLFLLNFTWNRWGGRVRDLEHRKNKLSWLLVVVQLQLHRGLPILLRMCCWVCLTHLTGFHTGIVACCYRKLWVREGSEEWGDEGGGGRDKESRRKGNGLKWGRREGGTGWRWKEGGKKVDWRMTVGEWC